MKRDKEQSILLLLAYAVVYGLCLIIGFSFSDKPVEEEQNMYEDTDEYIHPFNPGIVDDEDILANDEPLPEWNWPEDSDGCNSTVSGSDMIDLPSYKLIKKPVIYLYSDDDINDIEVKLQISDPNAHFQAVYPAFSAKNEWRVNLRNNRIEIGPKDYTYLFWESTAEGFTPDFSKAFCVSKEQYTTFLEEKLAILGLNNQEINDFITYWLPELNESEYALISFQEETYTDYAKLTVIPKPDYTVRVFMAFKPLSAPIQCSEPALEHVPERFGFSLIEWGGIKVEDERLHN